MEYRQLGPTDMTVSALGYGGEDDRRLHHPWGEEFINHMIPIVHRALDRGVNVFRYGAHVTDWGTRNAYWAGPWARTAKTWWW